MLQIIPTTSNEKSTDTIKYINNDKKLNSIAKKYNYAIENYVLKSNENIICFRHDDAYIKTPMNISEYKLEKHFEDKSIGVAGLIGTIALDRTCTWWTGVLAAGGRSTYGEGAIIQGGFRQKVVNNVPQFAENGQPIIEPYEYWMQDHPGIHKHLATVDGCCMFFPKRVFEEGLRFDESLADYHFYDTDISLQVLERGYKVTTIDIAVMHRSEGKPPENFEELKKPFFKKWDKKVHGEWPISRLSTFYKD